MPETIYLRIENAEGSKECLETASFEIDVSASAIAALNDLEACDENGNETASFDLTQNDPALLNGNDQNDFDIAYYTSQQDAINGTNPINDPTDFENTANPQTIWGKQDNLESTACFVLGTFDVEVFINPQIQQTPAIDLCHDDLNSFPVVDLTQNGKNELDVTSPSEAELEYYLTQADADAQTNEIPDPANFTPSAEQQDIFVRAQNIAKTDCHSVDSFVVNIYRTEAVAPTDGILNCSSQGLDPDTGTFDLTEKETDIAGPNQNIADINISYHPSQQDADDDANEIINPTAYQNATNPQIIYVRVENPDAPDSLDNCALTTSFTIQVDTLPEIQQTINLNECSVDGQVVTFDLSINNANSMGVADPANTNVSYYQSQADADSAQNGIANPGNYTLPNDDTSQTIYVRAENADNPDCFSVSSFELTFLR